jgi:hypothetical protein
MKRKNVQHCITLHFFNAILRSQNNENELEAGWDGKEAMQWITGWSWCWFWLQFLIAFGFKTD